MKEDSITMYRPVGPKELELIAEADYKRWPARLPEQQIFYPGTNQKYAREITEKLGNVPLFDSITGALTDLAKKGEVTAEGIKDVKAGSLRTVKISKEQLK